MKTLAALTLCLLLPLPAPALARNLTTDWTATECPLAGPLAAPSQDCAALRGIYLAAIRDCLAELQAEADGRAGKKTVGNAHTNRARLSICDARSRAALPMAVP